jgi:predicted ABC-type sugar transport system permease subunit
VLEDLILTVLMTSVPLVYAATGELIVERSGVLNLGVEGMMLMGAVAAFGIAMVSGSLVLGVIAGGLAGMLTAALFGILVLGFATNQVATGLALTIFGAGLSGLVGAPLIGHAIEGLPVFRIPLLSDLPTVGKLVFSHDLMAYGAVILVAAVAYFLKRTRAGLVLRAVGDNHDSAHALGYSVLGVRFMAVLFGGLMAGIWRCLSAAGADPALGRGHDRRARLDRAGAGGVRLMDAVAGACRGSYFRGNHHHAACRPGAWMDGAVTIPVNAALSCYHRRSCPDIKKQRICAGELAGLSGACVPCRQMKSGI